MANFLFAFFLPLLPYIWIRVLYFLLLSATTILASSFLQISRYYFVFSLAWIEAYPYLDSIPATGAYTVCKLMDEKLLGWARVAMAALSTLSYPFTSSASPQTVLSCSACSLMDFLFRFILRKHLNHVREYPCDEEGQESVLKL